MASIVPFNRDDLTGRLSNLSRRALAAFAASCAERLYGFYEAFWVQERVGSPTDLRAALDFVWRYAENGQYDDEAYRAVWSAVSLAAPDGIGKSVYATTATDAYDGVRFTVQLIMGESLEHAASVSLLLQDALDAYLVLATMPDYITTSAERHQAIARFPYKDLPLFVAELEKQEYDINILSTEGCSAEAIAKLKLCGARGVRPVERFSMRVGSAP